MQATSSLFNLGIYAALLIILIGSAILCFEIWMIVSAIRNESISDTTKILWVAGMIFIHPFVAIAYYFTDHKKEGRASNI